MDKVVGAAVLKGIPMQDKILLTTGRVNVELIAKAVRVGIPLVVSRAAPTYAAIKMANTGHLTFSTLHTNDAPSAVSRLFKMGIEPFLIANAINIIVAQRLIRTLCEKCKRPVEKMDLEYAVC